MFQEAWHSIHYRVTTQEEFTAVDDPPEEPDGGVAVLPHRAKHIFGMREQQYGTMVYYLGDWLLVVGPVALIIGCYGIGMPAPITGSISVRAGIWTPEREAIWLENARKKEERYGTGGGSFSPIDTSLFTDFPYVDTYDQPKFTNLLQKRFYLTGAGRVPQVDSDRVLALGLGPAGHVPGTPNTPAG